MLCTVWIKYGVEREMPSVYEKFKTVKTLHRDRSGGNNVIVMHLSMSSPIPQVRAMSGFRWGFELGILLEGRNLSCDLCVNPFICMHNHFVNCPHPWGIRLCARSNPQRIPTIPILGGVGLNIDRCMIVIIIFNQGIHLAKLLFGGSL